MTNEIISNNPVVKAVLTGKAPKPACLAAARGMLPLPQADLLEMLVGLIHNADAEIAEAAQITLKGQSAESLATVATDSGAAPSVLGYLAGRKDLPVAVHETVAQNQTVPDDAIVLLAQQTDSGSLLELLVVNQQRLLRTHAIMDAVLTNPARTPEAERRVRELQEEFFQKERGAQRIAEELRAQGKKAAAEFVQAVLEAQETDFLPPGADAGQDVLTTDDLWLIAEYIEVSDDDIDDSWLSWDVLDTLEESEEQRKAMAAGILSDMKADGADATQISAAQKILKMKIKDRVKFAMKGNREARMILIRDSNKLVSGGVVRNPQITESEVESISTMRSVSDEALRIIGMNRAWSRHYPIIHNLARNPRTPLAIAMGVLPRLNQKDLQKIAANRNVPEGIRRQAARLAQARGPR